MSRGSAGAGVRLSNGGEVVQFRSPAEFFAENQNIAGFDNPGKALYTTIREFVENSLDAAESIGELPTIAVTIEEIDATTFNTMRGVHTGRVDESLFADVGSVADDDDDEQSVAMSQASADGSTPAAPTNGKAKGKGKGKGKAKGKSKKGRSGAKFGFYKVVCKDNGVGMKHSAIPDMFGRVLAGSKYGVRQTRGKFGLGAKMALIWSRKSTGMPIEIKTAYCPSGSSGDPPGSVSYCKLDIDIHKNVPRVHEHSRTRNKEGWFGSEVTVYISGNWTTYRSRILSYMRQLAIITPYAEFTLDYTFRNKPKRAFSVKYARRAQKMPPLAKEVKHHPKSVNNLLVKQLLDRHPGTSLARCLHSEFACISKALSERLVAELGPAFDDLACGDLTSKQIHQLTTLLRAAKFPSPSDKCLSPAGEYNLRLGIMKELEPQMVATTRGKPFGHEGHPFIVEAGVSLGGKLSKEGITVHRFANRIPLLFEAGGDVVTKTAQALSWSHYKIDKKKEKIGVFVSIVSTKIPFKGTGKEFIGNDIPAISSAVKRSLQACCLQLKSFVAKRDAERDRANRQALMYRYIPDASAAILGLLEQAQGRIRAREEDGDESKQELPSSLKKRRVLAKLASREITKESLAAKLKEAVDKDHSAGVVEHFASVGKTVHDTDAYVRPLELTSSRLEENVMFHPLCAIRWFQLCAQWEIAADSGSDLDM